MSAAQGFGRLGRSFLAILVGLAAGAVLSLGTDVALHAAGLYPPWGQTMSDGLFGLAAAYRIAFTALGCGLAARLAPDRAMGHALLLGVLGLIANAGGAVATWDKGPEFGPKWYPLLLLVTALPCAWVGGRLGRPRPAPP